MSNPRIVAAFDCVHMGLGHTGLTGIIRKHRLGQLGHNECILFLNRKRDKLKVMSGSLSVIAYVKLPDGRRLPADAIQYIPQAFSRDGRLDIERAIAQSVMNRVSQRVAEAETMERVE